MKIERKFLGKVRRIDVEVLISVGAIVFYFFRLIAISSDLPNWGIGQYQAPDEGAYAFLALNKIHFGQINPDFLNSNNFSMVTAPHLRGNLLGNLLVYITISIFGKTYFGFRFSSFVIGLVNGILLFYILTILQKKFYKNNMRVGFIVKWVLLFTLLLDFQYTLASKVVETSIYRLFFVEVCILLFMKLEKGKKRYFLLLGMLVVFSVCGIYITNFFLAVAFSLAVCYFCLKKMQKDYKNLIIYFVGGIFSYVICEMYYIFFWKTTLIKNTLQTIHNFTAMAEYSSASFMSAICWRIVNFFSNNYNLYNAGILYVFLLSLPILFILMYRERNSIIFLNIVIYFTYFVQTLYSEDFVYRKYILMIPSIYILIYIGGSKLHLIRDMFVSKKSKVLMIIYSIGCAMLCITTYFYRLFFIADGTVLDFANMDKFVVAMMNTVCIMIVFLFSVLVFLNMNSKVLVNFCAIALFVSCFVINSYMDLNYIYDNKTFTDKEIMNSLGEIENQEEETYILGNYMLSYCFYNEAIPIVNDYTEMFDMMLQNDWYLLEYSSSWNMPFGAYLDSYLKQFGYSYEIVREFEREQMTFGVNRNIALYKIVERE